MGRRGRAQWPLPAAMWTYRRLLLLYPRAFRRAYGDDMAQVFGDLARDAARFGGTHGLSRLYAETMRDIVISAPREHLARVRRPATGRRRAVFSAAAARSRLTRPDNPSRRTTMANRHLMRRWLRRLFSRDRAVTIRVQAGRLSIAGGGDRFEKFTDRSRRVLSLAQDEAQRFNHHYIGTEHLLLGLVREQQGLAAVALARMGVDADAVCRSVESIIERGERGERVVLGEVGLTPRAKTVVALAVEEARRMDHHYVGTEHLLLGLVREGEGIAAGVLGSLGVRLEATRQTVLDVLREHGGDAGGGR